MFSTLASSRARRCRSVPGGAAAMLRRRQVVTDDDVLSRSPGGTGRVTTAWHRLRLDLVSVTVTQASTSLCVAQWAAPFFSTTGKPVSVVGLSFQKQYFCNSASGRIPERMRAGMYNDPAPSPSNEASLTTRHLRALWSSNPGDCTPWPESSSCTCNANATGLPKRASSPSPAPFTQPLSSPLVSGALPSYAAPNIFPAACGESAIQGWRLSMTLGAK